MTNTVGTATRTTAAARPSKAEPPPVAAARTPARSSRRARTSTTVAMSDRVPEARWPFAQAGSDPGRAD
jgi:hypothetical protein